MKYYELTFLISSRLSEKEARTIQDKIVSLIQREQGILIEATKTEKEKPTYQINQVRQNYIITLNFWFPPEKLEILEREIKEVKEIFRYLILAKKEEKSFKIKRYPKISSIQRKTEGVKKKVELSEIEKKLEEILGQ